MRLAAREAHIARVTAGGFFPYGESALARDLRAASRTCLAAVKRLCLVTLRSASAQRRGTLAPDDGRPRPLPPAAAAWSWRLGRWRRLRRRLGAGRLGLRRRGGLEIRLCAGAARRRVSGLSLALGSHRRRVGHRLFLRERIARRRGGGVIRLGCGESLLERERRRRIEAGRAGLGCRLRHDAGTGFARRATLSVVGAAPRRRADFCGRTRRPRCSASPGRRRFRRRPPTHHPSAAGRPARRCLHTSALRHDGAGGVDVAGRRRLLPEKRRGRSCARPPHSPRLALRAPLHPLPRSSPLPR